MSEANRRTILAAVGALSFGFGALLASLSYYQEQHENAASTSEAAKRTERRPQQSETNHAGVLGFAQELISNPQPTDDIERANRELAAQENTAAWAFWMTLVTGGQLLLSGLGLGALLATIKQGRDALKRATEANELARAAHVTETRPWLVFELGKDIAFEFEGAGKSGLAPPLDIPIKITNIGHTPASNVNYRYATFRSDTPDLQYKPSTPEAFFDQEALGDGPRQLTLLPGESHSDKLYTSFALEPLEVEGVYPNSWFYLAVSVVYRYADGKIGQTATTFMVGREGKPVIFARGPAIDGFTYGEAVELSDIVITKSPWYSRGT
ncbi:hypothetical protein MZO42_06010 [Sphingomonas psychrotolerans]|uniref:Uncharacterized protein n=1 Tax=Sphingomonas psychrotolerans TaxID=1327635 RepID=A0ABU3N1Y7_9SPHN|nr:hypothetical protein [Sphingomonas psychrotolerans]MDT8758246.1 hypothetical protein [Sphingomonas psychrotolerans]